MWKKREISRLALDDRSTKRSELVGIVAQSRNSEPVALESFTHACHVKDKYTEPG